MTLYDFRIAVFKKLLEVEVTRTPQARDPISHVLSKITALNEKGETNRKRCRVYSQKYHCEKCLQQPALCVGECFQA